jgi:hypothetical protein
VARAGGARSAERLRHTWAGRPRLGVDGLGAVQAGAAARRWAERAGGAGVGGARWWRAAVACARGRH